MSKTDKTDPPEADKEPESPVNPAGEDVADDDKVGYRRPPKSSQFKKGQSGNPLGSSRKARMRQRQQTLPFNDLIIENSHKLLRIREGNRTYRARSLRTGWWRTQSDANRSPLRFPS